ncbi:precorrin-6A synthase (deacetylating) [Pseudomonas sp. LRF_L74]|uniref:precorrin-6A synthase (deacetylating) n=1 Tax=Pseudomonas sp. LRF_L74 TaxID=3369422 RepID=UPI003F6197A3
MKTILIIGIGAGNPDYVTMQAVKALNRVDVFFVMDKGPAKDKLVALRKEICQRYIERDDYRIVEAEIPERVRGVADYQGSVVDLNRDKQALFERLIGDELAEGECGAFLIWGDPGLYDSTSRIVEAIVQSGRHELQYEVIPGITSIQALAAQHRVPLNRIGRSIEVTTGRRLAASYPEADSVLVMLDAEDSFRHYRGQNLDIYWGAYVGMEGDELLVCGPLDEVADEISRVRAEAREAHGWIMDSYLLRRRE